MKIYLKCFATLTDKGKCDYRNATPFEMPAGQSVQKLLPRVGVDRKDVKIAFVNNRSVGMDTVLKDGDRVALAPAVGGM